MNEMMKISSIIASLLLSISCAGSKYVEQTFVGLGTGFLGLDLVPSAHFDFGSERVFAGDRWVLKNNAFWMKEHPDTLIILEGHCDRRGGDEFNLELGDRRARGVRDDLIELGVSPASLIIVSYGELKPIDSKLMRRNRRVAFTVRQ